MFPEPVVAKHILFKPVPNPEDGVGGFTIGPSDFRPNAECKLMGWFDFLVTDYEGDEGTFKKPV
jgi:hypothetical protein